jgi:hypothetical protein
MVKSKNNEAMKHLTLAKRIEVRKCLMLHRIASSLMVPGFGDR